MKSRSAVTHLRELIKSDDPLQAHDLSFDARFALGVAEQLALPDETKIERLARLPATLHLLEHADQFAQPVPTSSPELLVRHLLTRSAGRRTAMIRSAEFFCGPLLDDPQWLADVLRYLPPDFRFSGSLFLIAGYDIGVALAPNASLNAAHQHFDGHPRELLYYAIHELHHIGFMTHAPPPRIGDLKTCADLLKLVDYSTALEGVAVVAALDRRARDNALSDDPDYVALDDEQRMLANETRYFADRDYLQRRGSEPVDDEALAVIDRMSGGERLWYRVGARMAMRIERAGGRAGLVALIAREPTRLIEVGRG